MCCYTPLGPKEMRERRKLFHCLGFLDCLLQLLSFRFHFFVHKSAKRHFVNHGQWSENVYGALPEDSLIVEISKKDENSRLFKIYLKSEVEE